MKDNIDPKFIYLHLHELWDLCGGVIETSMEAWPITKAQSISCQ